MEMFSCKTEGCFMQGDEHTPPAEGMLVCGLCGQEMTPIE
jgi:hypothetical protein